MLVTIPHNHIVSVHSALEYWKKVDDSMSRRVLSIGYAPALLEERHWLIRELGCYVTSVLGKAELETLAQTAQFDVVVIGPEVDRAEMLAWAKKSAPNARLLVLHREEDLVDALQVWS